jgi:hypothetical protein
MSEFSRAISEEEASKNDRLLLFVGRSMVVAPLIIVIVLIIGFIYYV